MIADTAAQDLPLVPTQQRSRRRAALAAAAAAAIVVAAVLAWPVLARLFSAGTAVSESRLGIATVERGPFVRDIAAEGRVVAAVSPKLYAVYGGAVELKVHAGDVVSKGQVVVTIASPELTNKLAQETSNAEQMHADQLRTQVDADQQRAALRGTFDNAAIDAQTAENDLQRQQKAFDAGAVSGMQVEHAKDTLEKARIALAHAKSGIGLNENSLKLDVQTKRLAYERQGLLVKDLQRQVGELDVRSPVDGQVGQLFVAERANVAKDAELLSVIDLSALEVQMQVPESFARDLAIGMAGEIGGNGRTWNARVSAISPEVVGGQVAARLRFDGDMPHQLRQNQRLSVRVLLDRRDGVLSVRRGSFVDESGGAFAYVVRDGIAEKTAIRAGASSLSQVEILDGLKEGDRVVVSGAEAFGGAARVAIGR